MVNAEGGVAVTDVAGSLDIDTDDGRATLSSISGRISVHADNGRVEGTDLTAPRCRPTTAESSCPSPNHPSWSWPTLTTAASTSPVPSVGDDYRVGANATNPQSTHAVRANADNGSMRLAW